MISFALSVDPGLFGNVNLPTFFHTRKFILSHLSQTNNFLPFSYHSCWIFHLFSRHFCEVQLSQVFNFLSLGYFCSIRCWMENTQSWIFLLGVINSLCCIQLWTLHHGSLYAAPEQGPADLSRLLAGVNPHALSAGGWGRGHWSALPSCKTKWIFSFTAWQKGHGWEKWRTCLQFCSHPPMSWSPNFVLLE